MGFRFSKSFKLGPARLNLSKRGLGMSVGAKGVRIGAGPRGSYTSIGYRLTVTACASNREK